MTHTHASHSSSHHRRTPSSSNAQKSSGVRPSRPALNRKNTPTAHYSISKLGAGSGPTSRSSKDEEDKLDMAASFLQYCATCERQITVPNNFILYCSESCRRKDSCKPLSASFVVSASMSPSTTPPSSPPMSPRSIVPPMTPTRLPASSTPAIRIPAELHDAKSDLDPTEWKPVIHRRHGSATSVASSEAWNFLSQFHGDEAMPSGRHPAMGHRSTSSLSILTSGAAGTPSLTYTPSTATSSYNSSSDYVSLMFDFSNRPLPPRHNPSFSSSAGATKGVGLVVPHMAPSAVSAVEMVTITSNDSGSLFPASGGTWGENEMKPVHTVTPATSTICDVRTAAK